MSRYVLDSYALLALQLDESGAGHVWQLLNDRRNEHWMTEVNLGEVFYKIVRERDRDTADSVIEDTIALPITFVDAGRTLVMEAAFIKANHALSYADCFAAALAQRLDARIVTGDPEFQQLEDAGIVAIEWLPKKKPRRR